MKIHLSSRRLGVALAASLLAVVAACEAPDYANPGGGGAEAVVTPTVEGDAAGQVPNGLTGDDRGLMRIARVDRSAMNTSGTVRYFVQNLAGRDVQDLSYRIVFKWPPASSDFDMPFESEVTDLQPLKLFAGAAAQELVGQSTQFAERSAAGQQLLSTELYVEADRPVAIVDRSGGGEGTRFANGALECTALSPEDLLYQSPPSLWIEFENVGSRRLGSLQIMASFVDTSGNATAQTEWRDIPTAAPGATVRVDFDLSGAGSVRNREIRVKVRQKSIF